MSRQTLFAICLVAGVVAMVSAQSFDFQSCSSKARAEIERYRQSMMQAGQKFADSMQQNAGQAMDMSGIQKDIDKMTQSLSSLTDMSSGQVDMGRVTSVYIENLQTLASIGRQSIRPSIISGGMGTYMDFMNAMMTTNTQTMQAITSACMPANRSS